MFAFVQVFPGYTEAQYQAVTDSLGPGPFPGLVVHLAGPCPEGWRIIQVWESRDDYARYERGPLARALGQSRAWSTGAPPFFELLDIHHVVHGMAAAGRGG